MTENKQIEKEIVEKDIENCKAMMNKINNYSSRDKSTLMVKCVELINEHMNEALKAMEIIYSIIKEE